MAENPYANFTSTEYEFLTFTSTTATSNALG